MMPQVIAIAGGETCQFVRTNGPNSATPRTIAVAIAVARHATLRRKARSVPCVTLAKGRIALSGPSVRKNRMAMSATFSSKSTAECPMRRPRASGSPGEPLHDFDHLTVRRIGRIAEFIGRVRVGEVAQADQLADSLSPIQ